MPLLSQTPQAYYNSTNSAFYGEYQFVSLNDIINQFVFMYVGEDKLISKASRVDVAFHAQRGLAELSFDTFKSAKALEIVVPETLQMILPQDYVNYTKISYVDSTGIKHLLYPASKTSNPIKPNQDSVGGYTFITGGDMSVASKSTAWTNYNTSGTSEIQDDTSWSPMNTSHYGLSPENAQSNGAFYIDDNSGKIHFSSNISGRTIILDYISDSLGTPDEMKVHKFAEEAMYKWISYAILSSKSNIPEYQVNRLKKERFAAIRKAKLRLSNIKIEEITQILRGKSKQIKH
jgi:hypothetical protein